MKFKKLGLRRIITSLLLVTVLAITSFIPVAAVARSYGYFTLDIMDSSKGVDLSGIKVDVYDSVLDRVEASIGASIYAHNYSYSTYTDKNGSVTFAKPSDVFLIMIDSTTLPMDIGIDKEQVFYHDTSKKSDSLNVSEISDVKVSYDASAEGGVRVDIFNANGEQIKADYTITPNTVSNARIAISSNRITKISGVVTVGSFVESYEFSVVNDSDPIQLVAEALEAGQISQEEALDFYLEIYEARDFGTCGTYLLSQLVALYEDKAFFNHLSPDKQGALEAIVAPPVTRGLIFSGSLGSGYLEIYDDKDNTFASKTTLLSQIHQAFVATYNKFVSELGYNQPFTSGTTFVVYLHTTSGTPSGSASCGPTGLSHSNIYIPSSTTSINNDIKSVVAHEYFHCITNTYRWGFSGLPPWFYESLANWAIVRQYGATGYVFFAGWVNSFLTYPVYSLATNIDEIVYGSALFPIYIHQRYGSSGDYVIQSIITEIASLSFTNVYTAISNALSGESFESVFSWFWANNYAPKWTYPQYANYLINKPTVSASWPSGSYPNNSGPYIVASLACQYIDFELPTTSNKLYVTINGPPLYFNCFVIIKLTTGAITLCDVTSALSSMATVLIPSNASTNDKGVFAAVNTGRAGGATYYLTIQP